GHEDLPAFGLGDAVGLCAEARDRDYAAHLSFIPPSRNSILPSPPSMGDGAVPMLRQPGWVSNQAARSSAIFGPSAGSRKMPPLPMASRPASNCGFTSSTQRAPGAASASAGGSASFSEMKLTSETTKSGSAPSM